MFYRPLIIEAIQFVWRRKTLWVFGLLAGILFTGGIFDSAIRQFSRMERMGLSAQQWMEGAFPEWNYAALFRFSSGFLDPLNGRLLFGVIGILIVAIIYLSLRSQSVLVTAASNEHLAMKNIWQKSRGHIPDLLLLNLFWRIAQFVLLLLTVMPFALFLIDGSVGNALLYFVLFLILFPLAMIVNTVVNLAIIEVVRKDASAFHAFFAACSLFKKHWLASIELSLILFLCSLVGWSAFLLAAVLFLIPSSIFVTTSLLTGLPFLFSIVTNVCLAAYLLGFALFFGCVVAFQFTAWTLFFEGASRRAIGKRALCKLERVWQSVF